MGASTKHLVAPSPRSRAHPETRGHGQSLPTRRLSPSLRRVAHAELRRAKKAAQHRVGVIVKLMLCAMQAADASTTSPSRAAAAWATTVDTCRAVNPKPPPCASPKHGKKANREA